MTAHSDAGGRCSTGCATYPCPPRIEQRERLKRMRDILRRRGFRRDPDAAHPDEEGMEPWSHDRTVVLIGYGPAGVRMALIVDSAVTARSERCDPMTLHRLL